MKNITIVGNGKFGSVIKNILSRHTRCNINTIDRHTHNQQEQEDHIEAADIIVVAVPLKYFKDCILEISKKIKPNQIIIEVCSTSVYPKKIMLDILPEGVNIIGSHPMFGPQTLKYNNNKINGLNMVIENIRCDQKSYALITEKLSLIGLHVVDMDADTHDRYAAKFHFLAQLVGNGLSSIGLEKTPIDTVSYAFLFNFMERLDPDLKLLQMMYTYNPYCKKYLQEYTENIISISQNLQK